MRSSIYDFKDYRSYLRFALPSKGEGRGQRTRLAQHLRCELSFISLVLNDKAQLALEQAIPTAEFLGLNREEQDFLLLLIQKERAGSKTLEAYFAEKISAVVEERKEIKARIPVSAVLSPERHGKYYGHWKYTAIHMCLLIPEFRTLDSISAYLGLPRAEVKEALDFLTSSGLAAQKGLKYESGPVRIHLSTDSPELPRHHMNWRIKTLSRLDLREKEDLHYTLVMSASQEVVRQIRALVLQAIQDSEPLIQNAKDESVYLLGVDLFEVGKDPLNN